MAGYFVLETTDKNPLINIVATNNKHTLFIRIKSTHSKTKKIDQIMEDNKADLKTLFHIPRAENVYVMFWVWFDCGDDWQRFFIDHGGNLIEIYETL